MAPVGRADGTGVSPTFPFTALAPIDVFAVEDTVAQFTWRGLPDGPLSLASDFMAHAPNHNP